MVEDSKADAVLDKLSATLGDVAKSMTQLQGDVAKIGARLVAIDGEVAGIVRRLDRYGAPDREG